MPLIMQDLTRVRPRFIASSHGNCKIRHLCVECICDMNFRSLFENHHIPHNLSGQLIASLVNYRHRYVIQQVVTLRSNVAMGERDETKRQQTDIQMGRRPAAG